MTDYQKRILKMLGIEVNKPFVIEELQRSFYISDDFDIIDNFTGELQDYEILYKLISKEYNLELDVDDYITIISMRINGYHYIARDLNGDLYGYISKPIKDGDEWESYNENTTWIRSTFFKFINFEDDEPYCIDGVPMRHKEYYKGFEAYQKKYDRACYGEMYVKEYYENDEEE